MVRIITNFIINASVIFILSIFTGLIDKSNIISIVLFSGVFTILCFTLRPILQIISLPLTALTFGVFAILVNTFIVYAADIITWGFNIRGFLNTLIVSIMLYIASSLLNSYRLRSEKNNL
ncbi:phage holin family protein [Clostridium sp. B9]|uniref:phage holin family protein n=1 Tax=Clostridium sp. B9 TaxID=3423224 RepID=UPI003D2F0E2F